MSRDIGDENRQEISGDLKIVEVTGHCCHRLIPLLLVLRRNTEQTPEVLRTGSVVQ